MRRTDREQSREFSLALIDHCSHGVAAISTGEDTPYCLPLSFVRVEDHLYFHCAKEGRKLDLLRRNPRMCITFVGDDEPAFVPPAMYTTYFESVIVTGTASEVSDDREKIAALEALCRKVTPDHMGECFHQAIENSLAVTGIWRVDMDQIIGKAKLKK